MLCSKTNHLAACLSLFDWWFAGDVTFSSWEGCGKQSPSAPAVLLSHSESAQHCLWSVGTGYTVFMLLYSICAVNDSVDKWLEWYRTQILRSPPSVCVSVSQLAESVSGDGGRSGRCL